MSRKFSETLFKEPDYSNYDLEDLYQVRRNIDPKYCKRILKINALINGIESNPSPSQKATIEDNRVKALEFDQKSSDLHGGMRQVILTILYVAFSAYTGSLFLGDDIVFKAKDPFWFWSGIVLFSFVALHAIETLINRWYYLEERHEIRKKQEDL